MKKLLYVAMLLASVAQAQTPGLSDEQDARYSAMIHELRCLVCQNETIADSSAPLALDLREQVKKQIGEGKSDAEVIRYLTDRYGDFVLYRPPFKTSTALLWLGPFLLLLGGLIWAIRHTRRPRGQPVVHTPVDVQALRALLAQEAAANSTTQEKS